MPEREGGDRFLRWTQVGILVSAIGLGIYIRDEMREGREEFTESLTDFRISLEGVKKDTQIIAEKLQIIDGNTVRRPEFEALEYRVKALEDRKN